jgi:hypothetical protein
MAKKPTVTTLASGFNSTDVLNTNFENLKEAFDNTLSLDGSTPNAMEADLDLNGNNLIGASGLLINGTDYLADVTTAKTAAETAQTAAETAETNAETAQTAAETAKTVAQTAQNASETSKTGAETAETNAAASATTATTKASEASTSASTATTKASEASASAASIGNSEAVAIAKASEASASATSANTAKVNAETAETNAVAAQSASETARDASIAAKNASVVAKTAAETAETNSSSSATASASSASTATTKASEASISASTATTKATESASSATASANSASASFSSASTATTKASEASASAATALSHKTSAETAKTAAETAQTNAETAETNSANSASASASSASSSASSASTATTKASEANASASTATTKASEASASASSASTSASIATTKAAEAAASVSSIGTDVTDAQTARTGAEAAYDAFDDRYLGSKSNAPSVDNDGNALLTGAIYWNDSGNQLYIWNGSAWDQAAFSASGAVTSFQGRTGAVTLSSTDVTNGGGMLSTNNLSDVSSVSTAKANLGLGSTSTPEFSGLDLSAIAKDITDTAVDVFVYDTSKDSDGGAWRKRTQGTSWYNETLNTATRGSRKEFPAVAVIVAESSQVTIYDGDDPDLPMWMVFNQASGNPLYSEVTSVSALNGHIVVGQKTSNGGVTEIRFINDRVYLRINDTNEYNGEIIADRNDGGGVTVSGTVPSAIVNRIVNDVAMTVLPNAPIDSATGLPVPTIAVACYGGVSFIKDDGTVIDVVDTSYQTPGRGEFIDGRLYTSVTQSGSTVRIPRIYNIPTVDLSFNGGNAFPTTAGVNLTSGFFYPSPKAGTVRTGNGNFSSKYGLHLLSDAVTDTANYLRCDATSTYNTGWMNGDIKGAFLSDTDDTDLVGSLFNSNSSFDTDVTGVTPYSGASTSHDTGGDGGRLKVTSDGTRYCGVFIDYSTAIESGKTYLFQIDYTVGTYAGNVNLSANSQNTSPSPNFSTSGTYTAYLVSNYSGTTSRQMRIRFSDVHNAGEYFFLDNVIIKEVDFDRSVNSNPLTPFGTITRTPVATGADLVAYSGFSASNYLEQPYNSDLDFGTGDFCVMGWATASGASDWLVDRRDRVGNTHGFHLIMTSGTVLRFDTYENNANSTITGSTALTSAFAHFVALRRNGVMELWVNGNLEGSNSTLRDMTTGNSPSLFIGIEEDITSAYSGSLALIRISGTAPSAEQIAKIYNDEKVLFQENAQATLYGSSDVVIALAHDDTTDLLHVGTSAGRSVFQGLRRVENTTDAVGTAISASNGLVVEE